jgi:hypothetical protein
LVRQGLVVPFSGPDVGRLGLENHQI